MKIEIDALAEDRRGTCPEDIRFGTVFSDHMFSQTYDEGRGWHSQRIEPYRSLSLDPAAAVLHYGQEVFEGLKAYRRDDGGVNLFRPEANAQRLNQSAARMVMPQVDEGLQIEALKQLVRLDERWVPSAEGASLYIRPVIIAVSPKLGLGAASSYLHFIITGPAGPYFEQGFNPVSVYISDVCRRAVQGGVGEAKTGGNYSASLFATEQAERQGYTQVLWLDAIEGRYVGGSGRHEHLLRLWRQDHSDPH